MSIASHPEKNYQSEAPKKVTDFLSASQDNDPMLYPGQRPEQSYVTDGSSVYTLKAQDTENLSFMVYTADAESIDLNDFLRQKNAPPLEDRIPVLGFGSNLSPGSLASKFTKVGRDDAFIIPTAYATLKGHDVVWSGGPAIKGNFIAMLYDGPEVKDTEVQVGVNFLTREQLLVMNATEMSYQLAYTDISIEGHPVRAYYYVGQDQVYVKDGLPVAIDSIPATGRAIEASTTKDLLEEVICNKAVVERATNECPELAQVQTIDDYLALVATLGDEGRALVLRKAMHKAIAEEGLSKGSAPEGYISRMESWANPSTLPTLGDQQRGLFHHSVYRLPTQELGEWKDSEARSRLLRLITSHLVRHSRGQLK